MLDLSKIKYEVKEKTEREKQILKYVGGRLQKMDIFKSKYQQEWAILEDRVFVRNRTEKGEDASDQFLPTAHFPLEFSVMRRIWADIIRNIPETLFGNEDEKEQWKVKLFEKVWSNSLEECKFNTQFLYAIIDATIKGEGWLDVAYLEKYKDVREMIFPIGEDGTEVFDLFNAKISKPKKILEYDNIVVVRRDPKYVWVDENCVDMHGPVNSAKIAITLDILDFETWRNDYKGYKNFNSVRPVSSVTQCGFTNIFSISNNEQENEQSQESEYVYIFNVYIPDTDECYKIANGEVIYDGVIPFAHKQIPLAQLKNIPYPGNIHSIGEVSLMQQLVEAINVFTNLMMLSTKMAAQPHTFFASNDLDPDDMMIRPNGCTVMPEGFNVNQAIQTYTPPDFSQGTYQMQQELTNRLIELTGVDTRAMFPPAGEKVTQTALKRELSNIMRDFMLKYNEMNGLKDLFTLMVQTLMQFYPKKKVRGILDNEGIYKETVSYPKVKVENFTINTIQKKRGNKDETQLILEPKDGVYSFFEAKPEFIRQQLIIKVKEGSISGNLEELKLKKWIELTQLFMSNPAVSQKIDWNKWIAVTIKKYHESADELLTKELRQEVNSGMTETEKHVRAITINEEYTPIPDKVNYETEVLWLNDFINSDEFKMLNQNKRFKINDLLFEYQKNIYLGVVDNIKEQPKDIIPGMMQERIVGMPQISREVSPDDENPMKEALSMAQNISNQYKSI